MINLFLKFLTKDTNKLSNMNFANIFNMNLKKKNKLQLNLLYKLDISFSKIKIKIKLKKNKEINMIDFISF